jgi:SAM-dependent methyltransferase
MSLKQRLPPAEAEAARRFREIVARLVDARLPEYDEWFYGYGGQFANPAKAEGKLRDTLDLLRFARVDVSDARVFDAGCGFGTTAILFALLGAEAAHGVDHAKRMIDTVDAFMPLLPADVRGRVALRLGSVTDIQAADDTYDLVWCNEAISHFRDYEGFINEARRILRPGGTLVISDGNNARNPLVRRSARAIWEGFERGEAGERVEGHLVETPFVEKRRRIIAAEVPELASEAAELAELTSGMSRAKIVDACRDYLAGGPKPSSPYRGGVPLNPDGGLVERLFDPYALARTLDGAGFDARVRARWGGGSGRRHIRAADRVLASLSRLTMYAALNFRIAAVKR